jgi:hypothetical protein
VLRLVKDLNENVSNSEFVRLHTLIYKVCTIPQTPGAQPKAGELYFRLQRLLGQTCSAMAKELIDAPDILAMFVATWKTYFRALVCLNGLFDYLNRYWIPSHGQGSEQEIEGVHQSVYAMGVAAWRDLLQVPLVSQRMLQVIWDMSTVARAGGRWPTSSSRVCVLHVLKQAPDMR